MPQKVAPGIRYWSREELCLRPPRVPLTSVRDKTEFLAHYSTGQELGRADTREWWREIQNFHMGPQRGWNDIAYGHGVDIFGNIFEGRGFLKVEAQSPGHNTQGTACVFLGNDDPHVQDVPDLTKNAFAWLYREYAKKVGHELHRMGHRDSQAPGYTNCPGDELEHWVRNWVAGVWKPSDLHDPTPNDPIISPRKGSFKPGPAPRYLGALTQPPTMHNRAVVLWQAAMVRRGWNLTVDGFYGGDSEAACRAMQHNLGLHVDGVVGRETWNATWEHPLA